MNSVNTTNHDGDVAVGRNINIGGKATVQGDINIKKNLRIDGWLDAKNIKASNKGMFSTLTDLKKSYPNPCNGWWAIVGNSLPGPIYTAMNGQWEKTAEYGGEIEIDIDHYNKFFEGKTFIPEFSDFINQEITAKNEECDDTDGEVVYYTIEKKFIYKDHSGNYYLDWSNKGEYMTTNSTPFSNKLYECNKKQYIYENGELLLLTTNPKTSATTWIYFSDDYKQNITNKELIEVGKEIKINDIDNDFEDGYLCILISEPFDIEQIASHGITIPIKKTEDIRHNDVDYNAYQSICKIKKGKIKNLAIKLK